jgi:photosystem II stability/assembly factor-like uncharacterized protein
MTGFYSDIFFLTPQFGYAIGVTFAEPRTLQTAYSIDGGSTWIEHPIPDTNALYDFRFVSVSTGYYTSRAGLFKTVDTGRTIQKINSTPCNGLYFFSPNSGMVYSNAFQITNDAGTSWQTGTSLNLDNLFSYINFIHFTDAAHGWMSAENSLYKTIDGGVSWTKKNFASIIRDIHFINSNIGYIAFDSEIYETIDAGSSWIRSCKLGSDKFVEIFFLDENTGWACSQNGYVYRIKH